MATYQSRQEPLTTCPYNPAHQVKLGRLQIHITKCRKSRPQQNDEEEPSASSAPAEAASPSTDAWSVFGTLAGFNTAPTGSERLKEEVEEYLHAPVQSRLDNPFLWWKNIGKANYPSLSKAHQEKDMKQCPFSAEHVVPASQLMHHIYTCPLNTTVERFLTVSEKDKPSGDVALPPAAQDVPTEENWDEEASGSASLEDKIPKPAVAPVFVSVQAMAPAQRRHYYASLHSKADELLPSDMKPRVLPEAKTLEEEEEELLQMPPMPKTESKHVPFLAATDGSNDAGNNAKLYPIVVTFCDGTVRTALLAMPALEGNSTGRNIGALVVDTLTSKKIPLQN
ncbi:hypothetical protein HPB52_014323 [Rhipicephalus sanguineus]|uniref:CHHC U11-48K-type domain-containing protein n=1 Tax=Rhipicephalus sanguineus TaxID=34632 RepID=A0A9D4Q738_RHISA|nr:hypothetical protein HPB52_014323 [Rhipicephalus sanguineus]